jgi:glutamine cyclotransferase
MAKFWVLIAVALVLITAAAIGITLGVSRKKKTSRDSSSSTSEFASFPSSAPRTSLPPTTFEFASSFPSSSTTHPPSPPPSTSPSLAATISPTSFAPTFPSSYPSLAQSSSPSFASSKSISPSSPPPSSAATTASPSNLPSSSSLANICSATNKNNPQNVDFWIAASVSLADGVQFEVVEELPHDSKAYTQGLTYFDGLLFESTGIYGESTIRTLDPNTGAVISSHALDAQYFAEGLVYMPFANNQLIQLTWQSKTGFVYDRDSLLAQTSNSPANPESLFGYTTTTGEGWGITYSDETNELIVSDGSSFLHFWDPLTLQETHKVEVIRQAGDPASKINELEFWRGRVLANVWLTDIILVIHPETGVVEKEYGRFPSRPL